MKALEPPDSIYKYDRIIGTGGIGSGMFFAFPDNETLGRNESRLGNLLPYKDYCKQHIILHYVAVLLGAGTKKGISVHPIGKVGDDDIGRSLVNEMKSVGMNTGHITIAPGMNTLFSVCMQYPDSSGGNITTGNSASAALTVKDIDDYFESSVSHDRNIVLSVPEVPLDARISLLKHGRRIEALNIACISSAEADEYKNSGGFQLTDILSINIDEARSISKLENGGTKTIADACIEELVKINPSITVLITAGAEGVYCFSDDEVSHFSALPVKAVSTAGAGDAFIAGVICGICCGLPLVKTDGDKLSSAVQLGILLAAFSVTSPDTIHPDADAGKLAAFAASLNLQSDIPFKKLFQTG